MSNCSVRFRPAAALLASIACFPLTACSTEGEAPTPSGATCPTNSSVTYEGFVAPFMTKYCNDCHGSDVKGGQREGAPSDHNFDSLAGVLADPAHIDEKAAAGPKSTNEAMPPSGEKPTLAERQLLGEWIACQVAAGNTGEHEHDEDHEHADGGDQGH